MNYQRLRGNRDCLLLEAVSGSRAYGLATPESDTDLRGVFILPRREFYGFGYTEQVSNPSQDETYYELKRYAELLCRNNPNLLELLATPPDCLRYRHPLMERFTPELFLSKLCEQSFAGYAQSQIRKARGLNKKIVRPVEPGRKSLLDFCHMAEGQGSVPLVEWLERRSWRQEDCGLAAIPHFRDGYALFHGDGPEQRFRGIVSGAEAQEVSLSSIPKDRVPTGLLHVNKDGYSAYCREYREYWDWVAKRNEARYRGTLEHGKHYDAKNMMHTFRLLHMALEIATEGRVNVRRPDREFLLAIRRGEFDYDDLVRRADDKLAEIHAAYAACPLPAQPDAAAVEAVLVEVREAVYAASPGP
ncbi:Predicted nucleotidyltransferase [Methylomagnum ishizawai]|uniref:Predicted nucleotidyltransferase n=1 Tax=Methylomagnum ishizawai TaxID=1760988 RepID=A0A1Y6D943_9GAMM|nr:nucleotidyltransferase domain-containing protein [Methylomagnum ishizawai]SMF96285.1 Predicted nucleotidyltransferase [Methylomagnum ishizawai]